MFTGIIENLSEIKEINKEGDNLSISLISEITNELKIDQSLSHNGVCLTVVDINNNNYNFNKLSDKIITKLVSSQILQMYDELLLTFIISILTVVFIVICFLIGGWALGV